MTQMDDVAAQVRGQARRYSLVPGERAAILLSAVTLSTVPQYRDDPVGAAVDIFKALNDHAPDRVWLTQAVAGLMASRGLSLNDAVREAVNLLGRVPLERPGV